MWQLHHWNYDNRSSERSTRDNKYFWTTRFLVRLHYLLILNTKQNNTQRFEMNTPKLKKNTKCLSPNQSSIHLCLLNSVAVPVNRYRFAFETLACVTGRRKGGRKVVFLLSLPFGRLSRRLSKLGQDFVEFPESEQRSTPRPHFGLKYPIKRSFQSWTSPPPQE